MKPREELWVDFCRFASAQVRSWDIDPMYPTLRQVYDGAGLVESTRLWRTFLYLTFYHVGTAERVWTRHPVPSRLLHLEALPTGTERRGMRGVGGATKALALINLVVEKSAGDLEGWLREGGIEEGGEAGWDAVRTQLRALPNCGPWSSYKWADLLAHTHGYPITASDIGVGGGGETAGPIPGMVALTGLDWKRCAEDVALQKELLRRAQDDGVPFSGLDQLETALCDFNSLMHGRYYVGHDIDMQMEQLAHSTASLWEARGRAILPEHRGETRGESWFGVRKHLKSVYLKTGRVLNA